MNEEPNGKKWDQDLKRLADFPYHKVKKVEKVIDLQDLVDKIEELEKVIMRQQKQLDNLNTLIRTSKNGSLIRNLRNRINQIEGDNDGNPRR